MGRRPCCEKVGLKRGPWAIEEDNKLTSFILSNGIVCWRNLPNLAGLLRCGKSCRLRWVNYLRPDVKRGEFTEAEDDQIIKLQSHFGNKWSKIASHFPGRTDNEIKNYWNTQIKKKVKRPSPDSRTHELIEQIDQNNERNVEDLQHPKCSIEMKNNIDNEVQDHLGHENIQPHELHGFDDVVLSANKQDISEGGGKESHDERAELKDDDYEMVRKSLYTEQNKMPLDSQKEANNQQNAALFLDEDFQEWLSQVESVLFSDGANGLNDLLFQEHEHNMYFDVTDSLFR